MGVWVTEALGGISHSNGTAREGAADGVSSKNRPADDRRPLWESTHHLQISVRSVSLTHVKVESTLWGFSELREKEKKRKKHSLCRETQSCCLFSDNCREKKNVRCGKCVDLGWYLYEAGLDEWWLRTAVMEGEVGLHTWWIRQEEES